MVRKKELPVLERVTITDIGSEGNSIARVDNQVVFVPMLIPGDVVDIKITRRRKRYLEGVPVKFHEYSPDRTQPACSHFGTCGGCRWQHLPYRKQLAWKERQVCDSLERIGRLELRGRQSILGSGEEYFYRNKLEYTFSSARWLTRDEIESGNPVKPAIALGFHVPGIFDKVLDISYCHLQPEPSNKIRNAVRKFTENRGFPYYDFRKQSGMLRNLIIRNTMDGQLMVIVVFGSDDRKVVREVMDFIRMEFPEVTSLNYVINTKRNDSLADQEAILYHGETFLTESLSGLKFRIHPKSFYQTNTRQALELYRIVESFAGLTGKETVYDLYTGTGTIACFLARSAQKVVGIEYIEEAVKDARENALLNGLKNTYFIAGDIRHVLNEEFFSAHGKPDVLVTDPPRAGMHGDVVKSILLSRPSTIVYVSCNPATQARDIQLLSESYSLEAFHPVDMFPQTAHVENVALLRLR